MILIQRSLVAMQLGDHRLKLKSRFMPSLSPSKRAHNSSHLGFSSMMRILMPLLAASQVPHPVNLKSDSLSQVFFIASLTQALSVTSVGEGFSQHTLQVLFGQSEDCNTLDPCVT